MKLDAALFYQESWADPNYKMDDSDSESLWEWGTKAMRDWGITSLTSLAEDIPDSDTCADASSALERTTTNDITNGGLYIMVDSSMEDLSADRGRLLDPDHQSTKGPSTT
ncbi:hypothetical protein EsH8_IV_000845 [Colletotrichum jinshuiense]